MEETLQLAARRSEILEEAGRGAEEARAEAERAVEEEQERGKGEN